VGLLTHVKGNVAHSIEENNRGEWHNEGTWIGCCTKGEGEEEEEEEGRKEEDVAVFFFFLFFVFHFNIIGKPLQD